MEKLHLPNLSLQELLDECLTVQEHTDSKLVHLQGAKVEVAVNSVDTFNKGNYADVDGDVSKIPDLVFKPIANEADVITATSDMLAAGGYFIFDEILFVSNAERRVFGYGILP